MKWLNYHHLYYFRAIASEGSVAKASRKLNVGQPALSFQLKQLEESLGAQLFERRGKSLILSEAGQVALKYAHEIFNKGEELIQIFNDKSFGQKKHYVIGALDIIPKALICTLVEQVKDSGKDCSITVLEESLSVLVGKLLAHELDVLLTSSNLSLNYDLKSQQIGSCNVCVYGSRAFQKLRRKFPQSLNGQPVILPTGHSNLRYDIDRFYKDNNMKYDLVTECQDSAVKKLLAANGKGLVFLPNSRNIPSIIDYDLIEIGIINDLSETFWLNYPKSILANEITEDILKNFKL